MKTILTDEEISKCIAVADRDSGTYRRVSWHFHLARAIEAAIVSKIGEAVAKVDKSDDGQWADILPDRSVKVNQPLYAIPFIKEGE